MQLSSIPIFLFLSKEQPTLVFSGRLRLGGDLRLRPDKISLAKTAQLFVAVEFSP